jgi:hypothetical protein
MAGQPTVPPLEFLVQADTTGQRRAKQGGTRRAGAGRLPHGEVPAALGTESRVLAAGVGAGPMLAHLPNAGQLSAEEPRKRFPASWF